MIKLHIRPDAGSTFGEVRCDPPYEMVASYLTSECYRDIETARELVDDLRAAQRGGAPVEGGGNGYSIEADATTTRLITQWTKPEQTCELPTTWFIDALEQWIRYLESRGLG
jgi:hypothetical protein